MKVDARMREEQRALAQQEQMRNEMQLGVDPGRQAVGAQLEFEEPPNADMREQIEPGASSARASNLKIPTRKKK